MSDEEKKAEEEPAKQKAPQQPPAPPAPDHQSWLREIVTTLIALALAAVTIYMLLDTYSSVSTPSPTVASEELDAALPAEKLAQLRAAAERRRQEADKLRLEEKNDRKNILLIATGLFGSVLGFYFGRVPTERRAERAEAAAETAQQTASQAQHSAADATAARKEAEAKIADTRRVLREALDRFAPDTGVALEALAADGAPPPARAGAAEASVQLRDLLARLD